jgi:hypothetical protein
LRLIDAEHGHLFTLPPLNVILMAPRPASLPPPAPQPLPLRPVPSRSLTVHGPDGAVSRWEETAAGWRKRSG